MEKLLTPLKIEDRYYLVQQALKKYILDNNMKPGSRLPTELELSKSLGISRTSLREALKGLQSLGVIEIRVGEGTFVRAFNFDAILDNLCYGLLINGAQVLELLQTRKALESYFIDKTILKKTEKVTMELQNILMRFEKKVERNEDIREVDEEFHVTFFKPLGNSVLIQVIHLFWKALNALREKSLIIEPDLKGSLKRHQDILRFYIEKNVDEAKLAMERHFESPEMRLMKAMQIKDNR